MADPVRCEVREIDREANPGLNGFELVRGDERLKHGRLEKHMRNYAEGWNDAIDYMLNREAENG